MLLKIHKEVEISKKSLKFSEQEIIRYLEDYLNKKFTSLKKEEEAAINVGKELVSKFQFIRNMIILLLEYKKDDKEWNDKQKICEYRIAVISNALKEEKVPEKASFPIKNQDETKIPKIKIINRQGNELPILNSNINSNLNSNLNSNSKPNHANKNIEEEKKNFTANVKQENSANNKSPSKPVNTQNQDFHRKAKIKIISNQPMKGDRQEAPHNDGVKKVNSQSKERKEINTNNIIKINNNNSKNAKDAKEVIKVKKELLRKDMNYYIKFQEAKRKIEKSIQELDVTNKEKGKQGLIEALEILKQLKSKYIL